MRLILIFHLQGYKKQEPFFMGDEWEGKGKASSFQVKGEEK